MSINEKLTTKLKGISKAEGNIGDALNRLESANTLVSNVTENLQKIRELWVKAKNGTNKGDELDAIQREMNEYIRGISDMGATANNVLFTGQSINIQIGSNAGDTMILDFGNTVDPDNRIDTGVGDTTPGALCSGTSEYLSDQQVGAPNVPAYSGSAAGVTRGNINDIDIMIKNANRMASVVGKYNARLTTAYDKIQDEKFGYSAYQSQVQDTDYAQTVSTYAQDQIRQRSATSILTQANAQVGFSLNLLP